MVLQKQCLPIRQVRKRVHVHPGDPKLALLHMPAYDGYLSATEFDAGYANSITPEVVTHWENIFRRDSADTLTRLPCRQDLAYGGHERNRFDFFPAMGDAVSAPLLIAIHGGLWFLFDKWLMHFLAETFTAVGFHVATINYPLAPEHSLGRIVDDCRASVAWFYQHASELRIDPTRISVLGHSAAGQLCTMVSSTRWHEYDASLPEQIIHCCVGISGFYDIEPFFVTGFQSMTRFAEEEYRRWNPIHHVATHLPPNLLITGGQESCLLQQMMIRYAEALRAVDVPVQTVVAPDEDHFSVLHQAGQPMSTVFQEVKAFLTSA